MTNEEVKRLFLIISNAYPSFEADDIKVAVWQEMLNDIPFKLALDNLRYHIQNQKFQPTIAEIRLGIMEIMRKKEQEQLGAIQYYELDENDEILQKLRKVSRESLESNSFYQELNKRRETRLKVGNVDE